MVTLGTAGHEFSEGHPQTDDGAHFTENRLHALESVRPSPMERLPLDILLEIFILVGRKGLDLLSITRVCRRWRKLAIEVRSLWTVVDNSSVKYLDDWLAFSRNAPLLFHINIFRTTPKDTLSKILRELPRVNGLRLNGVFFTGHVSVQ